MKRKIDHTNENFATIVIILNKSTFCHLNNDSGTNLKTRYIILTNENTKT